jgi:hypothetical protein
MNKKIVITCALLGAGTSRPVPAPVASEIGHGGRDSAVRLHVQPRQRLGLRERLLVVGQIRPPVRSG